MAATTKPTTYGTLWYDKHRFDVMTMWLQGGELVLRGCATKSTKSCPRGPVTMRLVDPTGRLVIQSSNVPCQGWVANGADILIDQRIRIGGHHRQGAPAEPEGRVVLVARGKDV